MKRLTVAGRMLVAVSMALSLLAALAGTTAAAPNPSGGTPAEWDNESIPPLFGATPSDDTCIVLGCDFLPGDGQFEDGAQEVYFPAVGNADESTGLGAAQTSITVQNLDTDDAYIFMYLGTPEDDDGVDLDNWDVVEYAYLSGGASKTFQASDLEIPAGEVRPVAVSGYNLVETLQGEGDTFLLLDPVVLAGVAKQAVTGDSLPYTTPADISVSGYNAIGGRELGYFDQLYFPIVQTNCGPGGCWNSILRIANMGWDDNAAVTVRFFPADDGSGSLQTGFQLQKTVDVGETWSIDLSEWVEEGWVGSAHVYTDDAVGAIVDRVKVGTDMWITNSAANANDDVAEEPEPGINAEVFPTSDAYPYVLFAPDVRTDYNGWNTGINVANTVEADTDVSIQYFGSNGNAPAAQTRRLAAHGMTYFYNPSDPTDDRCEQPATDVPGCEFIGGAVILSSNPVAVAVDGVKYFGNDANVGQAFSYSATANAYTSLQAALVQKGNPANGMGATSGINVMNPNETAVTVEATWLNPSGYTASNFGSSIVWVPAYSTGFVYTMFHNNLPNGFIGSADVSSTLPVVATTANVDYQVSGDGTAIFNLSNPCGFFRQPSSDECVYESPLEPLPATATITKQVVLDNPFDDSDELEPIAGALISYQGTDFNDFPVSGAGFTGANGTVTFVVPAGGYNLTVESLPDAPLGYAYAGKFFDILVVEAGEAASVTNVIELIVAEGTGTLTKELTNLPESYLNLESEVLFCAGQFETFEYAACADAAIVTAGYGELPDDADNVVSAQVPAGQYTICTSVTVWVADANTDGVQDFNETLFSGGCESSIPTADPDDIQEPILVFDGSTTTVVNDFEATTGGTLDIFVRDDETDLGIGGATVCFALFGNVEDQACIPVDFTGNMGFLGVPAGVHTITVSHPDYEQETAVINYSPVADLADGSEDEGNDADVVISLDPLPTTGVLDVSVQFLGVGFVNAMVEVYPADAQDSDTECGGFLQGDDPIASGLTTLDPAGVYSVTLPAGDYCARVSIFELAGQTTLLAGDAANDDDIVIDLDV